MVFVLHFLFLYVLLPEPDITLVAHCNFRALSQGDQKFTEEV